MQLEELREAEKEATEPRLVSFVEDCNGHTVKRYEHGDAVSLIIEAHDHFVGTEEARLVSEWYWHYVGVRPVTVN